MVAEPGIRTRLSVEDWIHAGFGVIAEDGLKALTIDRLCRRVGATKGSFYWHFTDMGGYRAALINAWATLNDLSRGQFDELGSLAPRERLVAMMSSLVSPQHWMLERAMREWARSEPSVAQAVRESDRRVLAAVEEVFVDAGFDAQEAQVRAGGTFAAGIGFLHLAGPQPNPAAGQARERFLEILLRR